MRAIKLACAAVLVVMTPVVLSAGQVYGTIVADGQPLKDVVFEIQCGDEAPVSGRTAADGGYRVNVPQQGQCTFALPSYQGRPSAVVFSTPNPALYNFQLVKSSDGKFELRRRA